MIALRLGISHLHRRLFASLSYAFFVWIHVSKGIYFIFGYLFISSGMRVCWFSLFFVWGQKCGFFTILWTCSSWRQRRYHLSWFCVCFLPVACRYSIPFVVVVVVVVAAADVGVPDILFRMQSICGGCSIPSNRFAPHFSSSRFTSRLVFWWFGCFSLPSMSSTNELW